MTASVTDQSTQSLEPIHSELAASVVDSPAGYEGVEATPEWADEVRRLAKEAKNALDKRCATLLERQQGRFFDRLAPAQADAKRLEGLAAQLADLGTQGGRA